MSSLVQRSDPRHKEWLPLLSQQVRLRNVVQIIGLNFVENRDDEVYFTLHTRAMSTPFFTSERLQPKRRVVTWKEIEPRQIPKTVRLSAAGFIIRVWSVTKDKFRNEADGHSIQQRPVTSWSIILSGLFHLGCTGDWNTKDFGSNTLLFRTPFGFFTSLDSLTRRPVCPHRYFQFQVSAEQIRSSYTLKKLSSLHSIQRSVLDEISMGQDLKSRICLYGYSQDVDSDMTTHSSRIFSEKTIVRARDGKLRLQLKEKIEGMRQRVSILRDEKVRRLGRVIQLKKDFYEAEDISADLMGRMQMLGREIEQLKETKSAVQGKKLKLSHFSTNLFRRKKELISELLLIYPISLVEGSKKYSINEIQLPNAEDYYAESGGQISVALGYTAHLTAMISFFLGIPLRYPVRHFGSQSRIVDHITEQITDREREFPLYFRNKEDVYSKYAVYLLNKNIAQLRWYCGLSTQELRATLPNLYNLLHARLVIPGWPPSPTDSLEVAQELTEEVDQQLFSSSVSLDKGLDQLLLSDKGIENTWLRSSYSDLEWETNLANNAVPSGEVKHGKAQDRFLNGWRKKTYESEEIDPHCLTNSLNLDFDGGRRLSTSSNSLSPLRQPLLLPEDPKSSRRRRIGRVEQYPFSRRGSGSSKGRTSPEPTPTIIVTSEPNENLSHIENEITKFERKRSACGPVSSTQIQSPDDSDIISTTPLVNPEESEKIKESTELPLSEVNQIPAESGSLDPLDAKYDPSSDEEREGSPIFFLPCVLDSREAEAPQSAPILPSPTPKISLEVFPSHTVDGMEINPMNLPVDDHPTFESSYRIQLPVANSMEGSLLSSTESSAVENEKLQDVVTGSGGEEDGDENFETDFEDELWLRTASLLNPQSFSVIKRRISESN